MNKITMCGFDRAWTSPCDNPKPCPIHKDRKCWKCGKPATSECAVASSLVCGQPECKDHPHFQTHYSSFE